MQARVPSTPRDPAADALYRALRDRKIAHLRLHKGLVLATGLRAWASWLEMQGVAAAYRGLAAGLRPVRFIPSSHRLTNTAPTS
jgi:hypothetical protein